MKDHLTIATEYINGNTALKRALGLDADMHFHVGSLGMGEHNVNFLACTADGAASNSAAFAEGTRFVLRVNVSSQPFHENQIRYEFSALEALAKSGRTPVPFYVDDSASAPGNGALVESFCVGRQLELDHLGPSDLSEAAHILADVHSVLPDAECGLFAPANPARTLFDECAQRFELYRASKAEDPHLTQRTAHLFAATEKALAGYDPSICAHRIVNTEPLSSHFLLDPDAPTGGHFIDWERPIIGDVTQDIAYFISPTTTLWESQKVLSEDEVALFLEAYWEAVDGRFESSGFKESLRLWLMLTALRSTTWCLRAKANMAEERDFHITDKGRRLVDSYLSDEMLDLASKISLG